MKKKTKKDPFLEAPFAGIEHKMWKSEAFKDLKSHTKWLYMEFRLRYHGKNPRSIKLTQTEVIEKKIMDVDTFRRDYKILIKRGLIDLVKKGAFHKQPHIFGLSNRWKKYGKKDFIEVDIDKLFPEEIFVKKKYL